MKVLLVDDEPDVREMVAATFDNAEHELEWVATGEEGLARIAEESFDAVILDIMMPGKDGMEVLAELRAAGDATPVIMLTAVDREEDIIEALRAGADGYMTKPFSPRELEARVQAICRRAKPGPDATHELQVGDIQLNRLERKVTRAGEKLRLTNIEFDMLSVLMTDPRKIVSRPELLQEVWNMDWDPGTGLVHVHMSHLREKLTSRGGSDPIRTVRGKGYVMDPLLED